MRVILFSADGARDLADEISEHLARETRPGGRLGEKLGVKMISRGARDLLDGALIAAEKFSWSAPDPAPSI